MTFLSHVQVPDKNSDSMAGTFIPAKIINNNDPDQEGKVQARVATFHGGVTDTQIPWCKPINVMGQGNGAGGIGGLNIPPNGSDIWVFFPEEDNHNCYYIGGHIVQGNVPAALLEDYPNTYGYVDAAGNLFKVNTLQKTWNLQLSNGTQLLINSSGAQLIVAGDLMVKATGNMFFSAGGVINMQASNVQMNSGANAASSLTPQPPPAPSPQNFTGQTNY